MIISTIIARLQQSILGLGLPLTCIPLESFNLLFIIDSLIETANGNMVPTDIRKIFILQIFGKPDFKNMWDPLLCIDMYKDG